MKNLFSIAIFCSLLFSGSNVMAQVGIGTTTPDANAQLDISSPDKGLLIPRMTEAARVGMGTTATNGLLVYQTDVSTGFYFRQNDAWVKLPEKPASTIIPYASGQPIYLTTNPPGTDTQAFVGFGSSTVEVITPASNGDIDLTGSNQLAINLAFSMPRAGSIESISGYFSTTTATFGFRSISVIAQLYGSTAPDNIFTPIPGALVTLSPMSGAIPVGSVSHGITTGLNITVAAKTRLLMVYRVFSDVGFGINTLIGYASGGVSIAGQ